MTAKLKRFYIWKNWLQDAIAMESKMIMDTTDMAFRKGCIAENKRLQKKLDYILNELK
jgi:hypothetical protein